MTSQINFAAINENFPVAGQDNDTQVFRDNFDTIKNNFRFSQEEITDLQDNVLRSDQENDLNGNKILNAVLLNNRDLILDGGGPRTSNIEIDFESSPYQIYRVGANLSLVFQGLPGDNTDPKGVGKLTVELYGDGSPRTVTLDPSGGVNYRRINWPSNAPTPTSFIVQSNVNPVIIELWRYSDTSVFVHYLGNFLPSGGGGTTTVNGLEDIGNVDVSGATNGQVLKYDSSGQQWVSADPVSLNSINEIADVEITNPQDQQLLKYNSSTQSWINSSSSSEIIDINEIGNVSVTTPLNGQVLKYNGINWVNSTDNITPTLGLEQLTNVNISNPQNNQILKYNSGQWVLANFASINDIPDVKFSGTPNNGQIIRYNSLASGWVNVDADPSFYTGSENLTSGSQADLSKSVSYFTTTTASTATLASGTEGQTKTFIMNSHGGNMTITVTNAGWASGTIVFTGTGQSCILQYINNKWFCIGNNGAVFS